MSMEDGALPRDVIGIEEVQRHRQIEILKNQLAREVYFVQNHSMDAHLADAALKGALAHQVVEQLDQNEQVA